MLNTVKSAFGGKTKIFFILICNLIICPEYSGLISQNINGRLGIGGQFIIRDTTNTFLTVPQNTGYLTLNRSLTLPNTTGLSIGVIYKGIDRFLHNFGTNNMFLGINAGNFTMTGFANSVFGHGSLQSNTIGNYNSSFGWQTLQSNTMGHSNSAFGHGSLFANTTGRYNTSFGHFSLILNATADHNSAFGHNSLADNTTGSMNSAFGNFSLFNNSTGTDNSAFGYQSLFSNLGNNNSAFGNYSLFNNTTGSNNTGIGFNAQVPTATASNQVRIGNILVTYAGVQVAWTITSDRKWKENILPSLLGLRFISKLNPVSYTRKNDESNKTEYGLIAQEVEQVLKDEGVENSAMITVTDEGNYELRYNDLMGPMIKAIQELNEENDELKERLAKYDETQKMLVNEIEKLKSKETEVKEVKLGEK